MANNPKMKLFRVCVRGDDGGLGGVSVINQLLWCFHNLLFLLGMHLVC